MILSLLTTIALAGGGLGCSPDSIEVNLAETDEGLIYRAHTVDVASYAKQSHIREKSYTALFVETLRGGDLCYSFGTLMDFYELMPAAGVAVTISDSAGNILRTKLQPTLNRNDFQVLGLLPGDTIRIHIVEPYPMSVGRCEHRISSEVYIAGSDGHAHPLITYTCETDPTTWRVIEERLFTVPQ